MIGDAEGALKSLADEVTRLTFEMVIASARELAAQPHAKLLTGAQALLIFANTLEERALKK